MSFTQPPIPTAPTPDDQWTAIWSGIGVGSSQTDQLVQDGTLSLDGADGVYGELAWFEIFPNENIEPIENFPDIHTGDTITAQELWSGPTGGGTASFIICDEQSNYCAYPEQTVIAPAEFQGTSAEWIVERPTYYVPTAHYTKLFPFGTVNLAASGTYIDWNGAQHNYKPGDSDAPAFAMDLSSCDFSQVLATTSSMSSPGHFSVTQTTNPGSEEYC